MTEQTGAVFTIGHSNHQLDAFVGLLKQHGVTAVADVRSAPFSRFHPQYNKDALDRSLKANGIRYVFLGRELGARSDDPSCYEGGRVQYGRLARTELFESGLARVIRGAQTHRIAMMCAEREPLECHRTLLVSKALAERGVLVTHILANGRAEAHADTMVRLLDVVGLPREDLFRSRQELLDQALRTQEERVAYVDEKLAAEAAGDSA